MLTSQGPLPAPALCPPLQAVSSDQIMLRGRRERKEKQRKKFSVHLTISSRQGWWLLSDTVLLSQEPNWSQTGRNLRRRRKPIASELVLECVHERGAGRERGGEWGVAVNYG